MRTLNARQAAAFLRIHYTTFCDRAAAGVIPAVKVGRSWVCIDDDLVQYVRANYERKTDSLGAPWGVAAKKPESSQSLRKRYEEALAPKRWRSP